MAYRRNFKRASSKKKAPKFTKLERLAYNMGKVKQGISNPDSRVHESYKNGLNAKNKRKKKTLF